MKKYIFRNLILNVEGFLDQIWRMFDQNFRSLVVFLQYYVIDLLRSHDKIKKFEDIDSSNYEKLFKLVVDERIVVYP